MRVHERLESQVRGYCRSFPTIFTTAKGAQLFDWKGRRYIDFLCGAGSLNYGHNNPEIKEAVIEYLLSDGILHGLDLATEAKERFLDVFEGLILKPRNLEYKIQFTGPTGANAVEAAFKLVRKATGRRNIISFTNGFHGVTLGALAATGNSYYRRAAATTLGETTFMPYDGYFGPDFNTLEYIRKVLTDGSSGVDLPAAFIVETVQGEGGLNAASAGWLQGLQALGRELGILLIIDDIQAGCGRTGTFFSFEGFGIIPDIVLLSKSLSGYGLPMSVVLIRPDLDIWEPGEHNGTFRGNNLAFVSAAKAIEIYWGDDLFSHEIGKKAEILSDRLAEIIPFDTEAEFEPRGRGLIQGIECAPASIADRVSRAAFERGLIIETSGADSQVIKCLPPLTIEVSLLTRGLDILEDSLQAVLTDGSGRQFHAPPPERPQNSRWVSVPTATEVYSR